MPGTRRSICRTSIATTLLTVQLAVVPAVGRAQDVAATAPESVQPDAEAAAPPAPDPVPVAPVPPGHTGPGAAPYILWGASVVSLGFGTAFGVMALGAQHDYDEQPTYDNANKVHNLGIAADVGLGLGLLLAITGTVFFFADRGAEGSEQGQSADSSSRARGARPALATLRLAPLVGHHVQGGTIALRF